MAIYSSLLEMNAILFASLFNYHRMSYGLQRIHFYVIKKLRDTQITGQSQRIICVLHKFIYLILIPIGSIYLSICFGVRSNCHCVETSWHLLFRETGICKISFCRIGMGIIIYML